MYSKEHKVHWCTECLIIGIKPKTKKINYIIISMLLFLTMSCSTINVGNKNYKCVFLPKIKDNTEFKLNDSTLMAELIKQQITMPGIAFLQMQVESTNSNTHERYKSKICIENKNLLGIKYVGQKEALGEKNGHAYYKTYQDCIKDYKRLEKYYLPKIEQRYSEVGSKYTTLLKALDNDKLVHLLKILN
jgi:uncharacterized membrane protein YciS (DUF1049 family)